MGIRGNWRGPNTSWLRPAASGSAFALSTALGLVWLGLGCGSAEPGEGEPGANVPGVHRSELTSTFRDGTSPSAAYAGTRDTDILELSPNQNNGTATSLYADGQGSNRAILIQWDLSSIPSDSIVTGASFQTNIVAEVMGATYDAYALRQPWVENEATWNQAASGRPWQTPGALGTNDRAPTSLAVFNAQALGPYSLQLNAAGVATVQAWVRGTLPNYGVIIHDATHTNRQGISSRETVDPALRPQLTVEFTLPDGGSGTTGGGGSTDGGGTGSAAFLTVACGCTSADFTGGAAGAATGMLLLSFFLRRKSSSS